MRKLKVTHFRQDPAHCTVGACAVIGNFYDNEIDYDYTKKVAYRITNEIPEYGLDSGQICLLLNRLGFNKITLVTSDTDILDYSWSKFKKKRLLITISKAIPKMKEKEYRDLLRNIYKWYKQPDYDNNIIIDYNFGKYIRGHLNRNKPVILSFNWTMFFKFAKEGDNGPDSINGDTEEHSVVVYGYNKSGVYICDSHHQYYKYKRKKYRTGFYKISWENLMTIMGKGDVFLAEDYCPE